jgi:murein DD-endopeptidase MepM/ murein hydrolase activator NlpD
VIAPRSGRVAYAAPYRGYGEVLIVDHGGGWTTTITNLAGLAVRRGDPVRAGQRLGRAGPGEVTVELRKDGRPFPITLLL